MYIAGAHVGKGLPKCAPRSATHRKMKTSDGARGASSSRNVGGPVASPGEDVTLSRGRRAGGSGPPADACACRGHDALRMPGRRAKRRHATGAALAVQQSGGAPGFGRAAQGVGGAAQGVGKAVPRPKESTEPPRNSAEPP